MTTSTASAPTQVAVNDIGSEADFLAAIDQTLERVRDAVEREALRQQRERMQGQQTLKTLFPLLRQ